MGTVLGIIALIMAVLVITTIAGIIYVVYKMQMRANEVDIRVNGIVADRVVKARDKASVQEKINTSAQAKDNTFG